MISFSSQLVANAVEQLSKLPGVGKRTALRLVLHLLRQPVEQSNGLSNAIAQLRNEIKYCKSCHNLSDIELCNICSNPGRDESLVCVVEDIRDVMALESTGQYKGVYHVLNGLISPLEGLGPDELTIDSLVDKVKNNPPNEIILALSTTVEGETTGFYLFKRLNNLNVKISTIARGIAHNDSIEYADEITLGKSIINRVAYQMELK